MKTKRHKSYESPPNAGKESSKGVGNGVHHEKDNPKMPKNA